MADKQMKTFNTGTTRYIITDAQAREDITELQGQVAPLDVSATNADVGKALKAKTVANGKVTEYELGDAAIIDDTLSVAGEAADAKETGDAIADLDDAKVNKPATSPDGTSGQLLRTNGDGTTTWVDQGLPTDAQTADAVSAWLDDHPEATTTVQDGAITKAKLDSNLQGTVDDVDDLKSQLEELAENGYYEESHEEDHYLELEIHGLRTDGTTDSSDKKAHIWLTSAQEALTLNFDASVYKYNLCYKNNGSVVQYTSWLTSSPIEIDSTITHDQVGVTFTTLNSTFISDDDLGNILFYQTGGTTVGNLATKDYVLPKQQNVADSGKILGIDSVGIVVPVDLPSSVMVDDTLSISGDAADAKVTGDTIKELAENGALILHGSPEYLTLIAGKYAANSSTPFDQIISESSNTGYVKIPKDEIPDDLCFDVTKYKANTCFIKNGYMISGTFTAWTTASPISYVEPSDYDYISIMVQKLSGDYVSGELSQALYGISSQTVGNLATKAYVDSAVASINPRGKKVIYPDDFSSRIKPDIYYNGRYYADIDYNNYKIAGSGNVWVSTDGNDSTGDGSESNPYATITKALTTVAKTIHVKEGTYTQGTHYGTSVDFGGRNLIGHGTVILQNDSSGHYAKAITSAYIENIIFKHGNATSNSAFVTIGTSSGNAVCFVGCTFCDGGSNGLAIKGTDAILIGCVAYGNKLDGFNYHDNTSNDVTYIPNVLEIDCAAYNNGTSESGSDSCNGSTAHDGTKIIRLNGEYYSCYGGVIAEIARTGEEPTVSVNYGVLAHDSTSTGTYKASFWASINTQMYLYDCQSYGGDYDISAINDAKVVSWRLTTGRDNPSVNAASTATVIQH